MGAQVRRHGEFRSVTEVTCSMQKSPVSGNLFIHGVKWHLCVTRPVQPAWSSAAGAGCCDVTVGIADTGMENCCKSNV